MADEKNIQHGLRLAKDTLLVDFLKNAGITIDSDDGSYVYSPCWIAIKEDALEVCTTKDLPRNIKEAALDLMGNDNKAKKMADWFSEDGKDRNGDPLFSYWKLVDAYKLGLLQAGDREAAPQKEWRPLINNSPEYIYLYCEGAEEGNDFNNVNPEYIFWSLFEQEKTDILYIRFDIAKSQLSSKDEELKQWKNIAESNREANENACKTLYALREEMQKLKQLFESGLDPDKDTRTVIIPIEEGQDDYVFMVHKILGKHIEPYINGRLLSLRGFDAAVDEIFETFKLMKK